MHKGLQIFCHPECAYMSPWEKDQKRGARHKCTRYACYLTHGDHHPQLMRVDRCDYFNNGRRKMKAITKGELYRKVNMNLETIKLLQQSLRDRELKISELRDECAHRTDQFKIAMKERNELKGEVNDLSFKDNEVAALRTGIEGRDQCIEKQKIEIAALTTNVLRFQDRINDLENQRNSYITECDAQAQRIAKLEADRETTRKLLNTTSEERNSYRQSAEILQQQIAAGNDELRQEAYEQKVRADAYAEDFKLLGVEHDKLKEKYHSFEAATCDKPCDKLNVMSGEHAAMVGQVQHLSGELENLQDLNTGLVKQNSQLKDRLIKKAGQYRDTLAYNHGYHEQQKRDEGTIGELESKIRTLKKFSELKTKQIEKLRKYKDFFLMLKELKGVDISITSKTKET